jgi:hypothetical protein
MTLTIKIQGVDRKPLGFSSRVIAYRARDNSQLLADALVTTAASQVSFVGLPLNETLLVRVVPDKHRSVGKFVRIESTPKAMAFHCPVDPSAVSAVSVRFSPLPDQLARVLGQLSEWPLSNTRRVAAMMNVWAKLRTCPLPGDRTPDEFVKAIVEVKEDRVFFRPHAILWALVRGAVSAGAMKTVSGRLHARPGHRVLGSFKTLDRYGSLQLTFLEVVGTGELLVDADIDEASGIGHVFQVVRNSLPTVASNPIDIHQILTFHHELDVGYDLVI